MQQPGAERRSRSVPTAKSYWTVLTSLFSLTFRPEAISFDDISYRFTGREAVAPFSTGKISLDPTAALPLSGAGKITDAISMIDWDSNGGAYKAYSYQEKFIK